MSNKLKEGRFRYESDTEGMTLGVCKKKDSKRPDRPYVIGYYKGVAWNHRLVCMSFADEIEAQHWLDDYADEHGLRVITEPVSLLPDDAAFCPLCGRRVLKKKG